MNSKFFAKSKTVQGTALLLLSALAPHLGWTWDAAIEADVIGFWDAGAMFIAESWPVVTGLIGSFWALLGRITARRGLHIAKP